MKRIVLFVIAAFSFLAVGAIAYSYSPEPGHPTPAPQDEVKMPDVVVLGKDVQAAEKVSDLMCGLASGGFGCAHAGNHLQQRETESGPEFRLAAP